MRRRRLLSLLLVVLVAGSVVAVAADPKSEPAPSKKFGPKADEIRLWNWNMVVPELDKIRDVVLAKDLEYSEYNLATPEGKAEFERALPATFARDAYIEIAKKGEGVVIQRYWLINGRQYSSGPIVISGYLSIPLTESVEFVVKNTAEPREGRASLAARSQLARKKQ